MRTIWIRTALLNFFIAACMGVVLRFAFVWEIPGLSFKAFLHGHSHGAMLGWLYLALFSLFIHAFLSSEQQAKPVYNRLFWATQSSVVGMFISFPIQGYGPVSIFFTTLHLLLSYGFAYHFWKDTKGRGTFSVRMACAALIWMLLSTLGIWAMGPIMQSALRGTVWYYMAVQFFLHFQFNGWFVFGVLALFFRWLERRGFQLDRRLLGVFFTTLSIATLLTFALAVAWSTPTPTVFAFNSIGVVIQLAALWLLRKIVLPVFPAIHTNAASHSLILWRIALFAFIAKVFIQATVIVPAVAKMAYTIRNFVIGFVHLIMLGVLSVFIFAYLEEETTVFNTGQLHRLGIKVFIAGVALSELLLFLQGTLFWSKMGFLPHYYLLLFATSTLMPLGIAAVLAGAVRRQL